MYKISKLLLATVCSWAVLSPFALAVSKPVVYLSFDDGPSADGVTEQLLEVLASHNAKATFFVTGQRALKAPEKISAILYAGHAIGNHSHSHVMLTRQSENGIAEEFRNANNAVLDAGGPPLTCFRAPFGRTDRLVNRIAASMGMVSVSWSVDTRDWDSSVWEDSIQNTLDRVKGESIVLMHDGPSRRAKTVAALTDWMALNAHRFDFKVLPQCVPYGTSEVFATVDEQEVDLQLEPEDIPSLLNKLRNYRFSLQDNGVEQARVESLNGRHLAAREP